LRLVLVQNHKQKAPGNFLLLLLLFSFSRSIASLEHTNSSSSGSNSKSDATWHSTAEADGEFYISTFIIE
jgi:hypothetical protein